MNTIAETLRKSGIVPVVTITDPAQAVPTARALEAGGIPCIEVTFRTPAAADAIREITTQVPGVTVGAGTVLTRKQAHSARRAGAQFIVAPGYNPRIVRWCIRKKMPVFPGVNNPSDIESALENGLSLLKFFPAEASGGIAMLAALAGPYPSVSFMPTGGISRSNLADYIERDNVFAVGGSWMVKKELIENEEWETITRLAREAAEIVTSTREKK